MEDRLMSIPDVARMLAVNRGTVYEWMKLGRLKSIRLPDGRQRIALSEVERFISSLEGSHTFKFTTEKEEQG